MIDPISYGYRLTDAFDFTHGDLGLTTYTGSTNLTVEEIAKEHGFIADQLRDRASDFSGAFVLYDPQADGDGWLLRGDNPDALLLETSNMLEDLSS